MKVTMSFVDNNTMIYACVQIVQLCAQNNLIIVETKVDLHLHADICVVGDHCLVVYDHKRPVNVIGYNPKVIQNWRLVKLLSS